jgi:CheY-like chemotaxis protein
MKLLHWFDAYLNKPVKLEELREAMRNTSSEILDLEIVEIEDGSQTRTSEAPGQLRILVAEDHLVNQTLFRSILEKMGHSIDVAVDGKEAVEMAQAAKYDLIFMDIQMPNMNGLEATERLREIGINIPIVAVTANAIKEEMDKCLEKGMNDFLAKPFRKKDLEPVLAKWGGATGEKRQEKPDPPIDVEGAVETFMGERDVVVDLLKSFLPKVRDELVNMKEAFEAEEYDTIRELAHSIKGGAWNLQAKKLGDAAAGLEMAGKDQSRENCLQTLRKTIEEYKNLKDYLDETGILM